MYEQYKDPNEFATPKRASHLYKNQPKAMIKYINMQTLPCPSCKEHGIIARCSEEHLHVRHGLIMDSVYMIMEKIVNLTKAEEKKRNKGERKLTRKEIVGHAERITLSEIGKLKQFIQRGTK